MELASRLPSLTGHCAPTSAEPPTLAGCLTAEVTGKPSSCSGAFLSPAAWPLPPTFSANRGWLVDWSHCITMSKRMSLWGLPASFRCTVSLF